MLDDLLSKDLSEFMKSGKENDFIAEVSGIYTSNGMTAPTDLSSVFAQAMSELPLQSSPCPSSECWEFDSATDQCQLRMGSNCIALTCPFDKIELSFLSTLFGIEDNAGDDIFNSADECEPRWDAADQRWKLQIPLGNCGMTLKTNVDGYDFGDG